MEYPSGFPQQSRAAVEAEEVRASRGFEQASQKIRVSIYGPGEDLAAEVRRYILRIYAVFVREACKLGCVWSVDRIRSCAREFLRTLTSKAWSEKGYDEGGTTYPGQIRRIPDMTSHLNGAILPNVMSKFEKSIEWQQSEGMLLEVAEAQAAGRTVPSSGATDTSVLVETQGRAKSRLPIVEQLPKLTSSSGAVGETEERAPKRRHGFKADMALHERIASFVDRHAPRWRTGLVTFRKGNTLRKICMDLDQAEIDIPAPWKRGTTRSLRGVKIKNWTDALQLGSSKLVADQIRTSLNKVGKARPVPRTNAIID